MNIDKVLARMARIRQTPQVLQTVARDVGFALSQGERDSLIRVARELAANCPAPDADSSPTRRVDRERDRGLEHGTRRSETNSHGGEYWAGFAAGIGLLLASYEAAHSSTDARAVARAAVRSNSARRVLCALVHGPANGAELAQAVELTASAVSKTLAVLRNAGLVRILGGQPNGTPLPKRGARKPHALTPMGASIAAELTTDHDAADNNRAKGSTAVHLVFGDG